MTSSSGVVLSVSRNRRSRRSGKSRTSMSGLIATEFILQQSALSKRVHLQVIQSPQHGLALRIAISTSKSELTRIISQLSSFGLTTSTDSSAKKNDPTAWKCNECARIFTEERNAKAHFKRKGHRYSVFYREPLLKEGEVGGLTDADVSNTEQ